MTVRAGACAAVALAATAAAVLPLAACRRAPRCDSLVLITLDTLRWDHVSCYGPSPVATPNIDAVARRGALVRHAWTTVPLTTPAHASILTGLTPLGHGVRNNARFRLPDDVTTLAEVFQAAGRQTAAFVASFTTSRAFGLAQGCATFDDDLGTTPDGARRAQRPADEVADRAVGWLTAHADRPFFLWVHFYDPHAPYTPPPALAAAHPGDPYSGEVAFTDQQLGRVLGALQRSPAAERTAVAILADHGEGLGDHGEDEHGFLLYETTLRVPFVFAAPGSLKPGSVIDTPASVIDVLPTLLPLAGLQAPRDIDGRDLLAPSPAGAPRALYAETLYPYEEFGWSPLFALRRGTEKLIDAPAPGLFEIGTDLVEAHDLAARAPDRVREAQAALRALGSALVRPARLASAAGLGAAPDAETLARLESLGYIAGGGGAGDSLPTVGGRNPESALGDLARFHAAQEALGRRDPAAAQALLAPLVAADPSNPQFRLKLAQVLERLGRDRDAAEQYGTLLRARPDFYLGARSYGAFLVRTGRAREAVAMWRGLAARLPGYVGLTTSLARALLAAGDAGAARHSLDEYTAEHPQDSEGWAALGDAALALGDAPRALEVYQKALALTPTQREAIEGAVSILLSAGQRSDAQRLIERLLERAPHDPLLLQAQRQLGAPPEI